MQKVETDIVIFNGNVLGHAWHTWYKKGTNLKRISCFLLICHIQIFKSIDFRTMAGLWKWITFSFLFYTPWYKQARKKLLERGGGGRFCTRSAASLESPMSRKSWKSWWAGGGGGGVAPANVQTTANVQTRRQQYVQSWKKKKRHRQQMCKRGDSKCAIFNYF